MLHARTHARTQWALVALVAVTQACSPADEDDTLSHGALTGGAMGWPDGAESLGVSGGGFERLLCMGTAIGLDHVVTAAHCFRDRTPDETVRIVFGSQTLVLDPESPSVFLHPAALAGGDDAPDPWDSRFGPCALNPAHDLAVVRFPGIGLTVPPRELFHPACSTEDPFCVVTLDGLAVQLPGRIADAPATGASNVLEIVEARSFRDPDCGQPDGDPIIATDPAGDDVTAGDSGGGLLVAAPMVSAPLLVGPCVGGGAASSGELALLGVASIASTRDGQTFSLFAPTYTSENADFIASFLAQGGDRDGDGICDLNDGCPDAFSDGTNSNRDAEEAWGSAPFGGSQFIDDVCDPAPTPIARTAARFAAVRPGARIVKDQLLVEPVLGTGAPVTFPTTFRFCNCREEDGMPISDPERCLDPPYHCALDPRLVDDTEFRTQEEALPEGTTTWHRITTLPPGLSFCPFVLEPERCVGATFNVTAPSSEQYLGTWDYAADEARWTSPPLAYFPAAPSYPSSEVAPGANLAGVLWSHGQTSAGAFEHGLPSASTCLFDAKCTIADHYTFRALSDPATPVDRYAPPFLLGLDFGALPGSPARFPGEGGSAPRPFVTIDPASLRAIAWMARGERAAVSDVLSEALRTALVQPALLWLPPSEPLSAAQSQRAPLAFGLRRSNGAIVDAVVATSGGALGLVSEEPEGSLMLTSASPAHLSARTGYGAVYSRLFELVAVFGGTSAGATVSELTVFTGGETRTVSLWGKASPRRVVAATFAGRDRRLWAIDERARRFGPARRWLVRIDPTTGHVETRRRLGSLEGQERVWLRATPEGEALLVTTGHLGHRVFVLRAARFDADGEVRVRGFRFGLGRLETLPLVSRGAVSAGVRVRTAFDDRLESRIIAELDRLHEGPCELDDDLR